MALVLAANAETDFDLKVLSDIFEEDQTIDV